jgi:hypothetical protein
MWKASLKEGETYVMKNFKVHKNDFFVMSCVHPFKLVFVGGTWGTNLTPVLRPDIPHYKLYFKPYHEIMSDKYRHDLLVGESTNLNLSMNIFFHFFVSMINFVLLFRHYWRCLRYQTFEEKYWSGGKKTTYKFYFERCRV